MIVRLGPGHVHRNGLALMAMLVASTGCPTPSPDGGQPPDSGLGVVVDSGIPHEDGGRPPADGGTKASDGGPPTLDAGPPGFDAGPAPVEALLPTPGELTVMQLSLPALNFGFSPPLGEAAIIVGPDGTLTLLDVGNVMHDDEVRDHIRWLNEDVLTPERGYTARAPLQVEWIVLTHFHSDHVGAFERLTVETTPLVGLLGVVHRGFVGLGPAVTESDFEEVCNALRGPLVDVDTPLCFAEDVPPCDADLFASDYPAVHCDALPLDIALGGDATMTIVAASGHVTDGSEISSLSFGVDDSNQENARSLAGVIAFGAFRYHFGGDMTGSGVDTEPDVESLLIESAGATTYGPLGVDVAHSHHHARRTSNNATLIEAMAPQDGRARNVVAGINPAHLGSPQADVLSRWADGNRLNGGRFWVTHVTVGGASHPLLEDADGNVVTQTFNGGSGYWMQAVPNDGLPRALSFPSVRAID